LVAARVLAETGLEVTAGLMRLAADALLCPGPERRSPRNPTPETLIPAAYLQWSATRNTPRSTSLPSESMKQTLTNL
jgi:hypothetical protein